jgi:hypothetical protein
MSRRGLALRSALTFSLALASFAAGRATEQLIPDASWWQGLTVHDRAVSVVGLTEGYTEGYSAGYVAGVVSIFKLLSKESRGRLLVDGRYAKSIETGNVGMSKTYGTYSDDLTHFYENYPALSDLPVGRLLQCMIDHPKQSCDEMAAAVIKARSSSAPH